MSENDYDLTGKRAALYVRVSSDEQAKHGLSLDEQEYTLKQYAHKHRATIVGIYRDEGTTARKNLKSRKELKRLLQDVKAGKVDVILVIKIDRWFRNVGDFYKVQEVLDAHQVKWIATQEDYNTTTGTGLLMLNLRLSIAQNESDQTRERVKFVLEGLKREKKALTGHLLYGYKRNAETRKIEIDEPKAAVIREMFQLYCNGMSVHDILIRLNEKYGLKWRPPVYYDKLRNKKYIGTFYKIPDYAPAIIDNETFTRAQTLLAMRRRTTAPNKKYIYLFTGLVFCPVCGHRLVGTVNIQKHDSKKTGESREYKYPLYNCRYHLFHQCTFKRIILEKHLERYLLDNLQQELVKHQADISQQDDTALLENKEHAIKEKLQRLSIVFVNGTISEDVYKKMVHDCNRQLAKLKSQYKVSRPTKAMQDVLAYGMSAIYNKLSPKSRHQFWHAILERIDIVKYEGLKAENFIYKLTFL